MEECGSLDGRAIDQPDLFDDPKSQVSIGNRKKTFMRRVALPVANATLCTAEAVFSTRLDNWYLTENSFGRDRDVLDPFFASFFFFFFRVLNGVKIVCYA